MVARQQKDSTCSVVLKTSPNKSKRTEGINKGDIKKINQSKERKRPISFILIFSLWADRTAKQNRGWY
jgi:hypothetical protein